MDDMVAQGVGAIIIIYGSLIVIFLAVLTFLMHFWHALVTGDTGFILLWGAIILVLVSLYATSGLLLRKFGII
jgi:hypothetical protein